MTPREEMLLYVGNMPLDASERMLCPACKGGTEGELSLSVKRGHFGQFGWLCFRSSCGFKGSDFAHAGEGQAAVPAPRKEPRYYTRPTVYPSPEQHALIKRRFGLDDGTVDRYSPHDDRFILDIKDFDRNRLGCVAYSLSGATPKALTYNERPEEPWMHFAGSEFNDPNVQIIVEDWFSAEKVAQAGYFGVAIMGTHLNDAMVKVLAGQKFPTILAFDRDAYAKAIQYQQKYKERFKYGLKVWQLDVDLKYETEERIKEAVADGSGNLRRDDAIKGSV